MVVLELFVYYNTQPKGCNPGAPPGDSEPEKADNRIYNSNVCKVSSMPDPPT